MDGVTLEVTLIFIVLILLAVTLFLGVMNALFLSKLYHLISRQMMKAGERREPQFSKTAAVTSEMAVPAQKVAMPPKADISRAHDISDGLRIICDLYGLDALTISSTDGLAIGSFGAESGVAEAARYSHLHMLGETIPDEGVTIFQMDYHGSPLLAIVRSREVVPPEATVGIENEVRRLFEKWL